MSLFLLKALRKFLRGFSKEFPHMNAETEKEDLLPTLTSLVCVCECVRVRVCLSVLSFSCRPHKIVFRGGRGISDFRSCTVVITWLRVSFMQNVRISVSQDSAVCKLMLKVPHGPTKRDRAVQ